MKLRFLFYLAFACIVLTGCVDNSREISEANKKTAGPIISALEKYFQDNQHFPLQLEDLVPQYLSDVPESAEGFEFFYRPDKTVEYYLCFEISSGKTPGCCYIPQHEVWDCTRGVE